MQHIAKAAARIAEAQAEAHIAEQSRIAVADHARSPGAADIAKYRRADTHQPKRVPVGVDALFQSEDRTRGSRLVAQRVPAQAVISAQQ